MLGAVVGVLLGVATPAHFQVAGSDATVRLHPGRTYDEVTLGGSVLTGKRVSDRSILGQPLGVTLRINLDPSTLINDDGTFDANVLPGYVQTFSDTDQLRSDLLRALRRHLVVWTAGGAIVALALLSAVAMSRRALRRRISALGAQDTRAVRALTGYQRASRRRLAVAVALLAVLATVPSASWHSPRDTRIVANALLDDTPLRGTEVGGLLRPALTAIVSYIKTYVSRTDEYYTALRTKVVDALRTGDVQLPGGNDGAQFLFVTDRHCNIGMDRVIVAVAQHFGIKVLVSGGDDDLSGSFGFEAACTENLARKSQNAGMTDVFVTGNHDSAQTINDERSQRIKVLDGSVVQAGGVRFVGLPDPRSSRYGQGIVPSSPSGQEQLLVRQGQQAGRTACASSKPVVLVLHDREAGSTGLLYGCGKARLALDGHTHVQEGPTPTDLPDGTTGYRFVGGSTGGAPSGAAVDRSLTSQVTVGPLNHDASLQIVTVSRSTGDLIGITVVQMTPTQDVSVQELVPAS